MCFTGGFALATAIEGSVLASVLSQPAVPFPTSRARRLDPGASRLEMDALAARTSSDELCVLGLRFSEDASSPRSRFDTIKARLGDAFEVIELDSAAGNSSGYPRGAHSVLTSEVRATPPNSAFETREHVVEFLRQNITRKAD
jgi:hypothetical protein